MTKKFEHFVVSFPSALATETDWHCFVFARRLVNFSSKHPIKSRFADGPLAGDRVCTSQLQAQQRLLWAVTSVNRVVKRDPVPFPNCQHPNAKKITELRCSEVAADRKTERFLSCWFGSRHMHLRCLIWTWLNAVPACWPAAGNAVLAEGKGLL
jgi:hypothetical protein